MGKKIDQRTKPSWGQLGLGRVQDTTHAIFGRDWVGRPPLRGSAEKLSKNGLFSRQTRIYYR